MNIEEILLALGAIAQRQANGVGYSDQETSSYIDALILLDGITKFSESKKKVSIQSETRCLSLLSKCLRHHMSQQKVQGGLYKVPVKKIQAELCKGLIRQYSDSMIKTIQTELVPTLIANGLGLDKDCLKLTLLFTAKCDGLFVFIESEGECHFGYVSFFSKNLQDLSSWVYEVFSNKEEDSCSSVEEKNPTNNEFSCPKSSEVAVFSDVSAELSEWEKIKENGLCAISDAEAFSMLEF